MARSRSRTSTAPHGRKMPPENGEFALEGLIGYNLKRAYVIVQEQFRAAMGDDGMSPRVFSALSLIVEIPNMTQSDLARLLGIERSGLVAIIDELEGRDYLKRVAVPGDRRVQALSPTPEGARACSDAIARVKTYEDAALNMLEPDEKDQLLALLKKVRIARTD